MGEAFVNRWCNDSRQDGERILVDVNASPNRTHFMRTGGVLANDERLRLPIQ